MSASAADPFAALIDLVREAAREGTERALAAQRAAAPSLPIALLDKRELAHALRVSVAKVDRLSRDGRIPFLIVGDVRRFDLIAVLAALPQAVPPTDERVAAAAPARRQVLPGVRLLSRGPRRSS